MKIFGPTSNANEANLSITAKREVENQNYRTTQRRQDDTSRAQDHAREVRAQEERIAVGRNLDAKA